MGANSSNSRSEFMYRGAGMTSIGGGQLIGNTAGTGALNLNSNMNESDLEIEFGYCSEEESVFQSFCQEVEKNFPKIKKAFNVK